MDIAQLLAFSVKNGASDLHLSAGLLPMIRVDGDVRRINVDPMDHEHVHGMLYDIMNDNSAKPMKSTGKPTFLSRYLGWRVFVSMHLIITVVQVLFSERFRRKF